jgi:hypothetical protein
MKQIIVEVDNGYYLADFTEKFLIVGPGDTKVIYEVKEFFHDLNEVKRHLGVKDDHND